MKKLIASSLLPLVTSSLCALPLGNPTEASLLSDGLVCEGPCYSFCQQGVTWCQAFSLRTGYYGDFVFNRRLEVHEHDHGEDLQDTELYTNAGYIVINFFDTIDLFAALGGTSSTISSNTADFGAGFSARATIQMETDFSWSAGARATIYKCGYTQFGFVGQYFSTRPSVSRIIADNLVAFPRDYVHMKYYEWQLGFGVAHRLGCLVPYLGVKIGGAKANFDSALITFEQDEKEAFSLTLRDLANRFEGGLVAGVTLVDCQTAAVTAEYRFPDEHALYINGVVRF